MRRFLSFTTAIAAAFTLSACAGSEPARPDNPRLTKSISISVGSNSTEQLVLGEIYSQAFAKMKRASSVSVDDRKDPGELPELIMERKADFVVTCSGSALQALNPAEAKSTLEGDRGDKNNPNDTAYDDRVVKAMQKALPPDVESGRSSSAKGCGGSKNDPRNVVPVYSSDLFDRGQKGYLEFVTTQITTDDLQKMAKEAEKSGSVREAVSAWAKEKRI